ncbi:unnamed protein product [Macrosiphum euphorbiae]|uniref:Uncharacterized protein n=1 Tax=Macrosiphum euphorbiae TaxID=13131 RepID=A0AAV0X2N4_9HEMI|nr:unnamed protein product [Macrosiphum euphorbiae]
MLIYVSKTRFSSNCRDFENFSTNFRTDTLRRSSSLQGRSGKNRNVNRGLPDTALSDDGMRSNRLCNRVRLCRPGSIIVKSQQSFLAHNERMLWKKRDALR